MNTAKTIAVTGAYGYSGKYMARRLLAAGQRVITLTSRTDNAFDGRVPAYPFDFEQPERLRETLRGVDTLINTYWVRFNHGAHTHTQAVANTRVLFQAAQDAGVQRIVHVSITNPSLDSPLSYFKGKAQLEADLTGSGMNYTILRPAVIFGYEDILINNIAWFLRRLPAFGVPGDGAYQLQPIHVEDMAALAAHAVNATDNAVIDAIGPETFTFNALVGLIREAVGSRAAVLHVPPMAAYAATRAVGLLVGDMILTKTEIIGLLDNLLVTDSATAGETKLSDWVMAHCDTLGTRYANELQRHFIPNHELKGGAA